MYSDENKSSAIAAILNRFDYVLIDTCSLMDPACPIWMDALHNAKDYRKKREPIIVPRRCYDELKKHSRDKTIDSRRISAKRGLKILRKAKWDRLLAVAKKDKNENFADNAIYVKVCADRLFSRILIITQDKSLASDLLALNKLRSQQGRPVEVYKLVGDGKMVPNLGETRDDRNNREHRVGGHPKPTSLPKPEPPKKEGTTPADIQAADARLCAVLGNPNYPEAKKRADVEAQLKAIQALPASTRSKLTLKMTVEKLNEYLGAPSPAPKAVEKKANPVGKSAKPVEKKPVQAPKKEDAPVKKEEPAKKLWYGNGKTIKEAFLDCGKHYGILFRSTSVKYFPEAHGPLDVTEADLDTISMRLQAKLVEEEKASLVFLDTPFIAQKHDGHYHCYIDVLTSPAFQTAKPAEKAKATPKQKAKVAKPEPVAESKPEEKKPEPKKPAAKKAPAKAKAAVEPKAETPAKETAEKPAKQVKKPAKKVEKPAKVDEKAAAETPVQEVKKATKAPKAKKPSPAKEEAPKAEEKKADKPASSKPTKKANELTPLEQAKKGERSLKCNLKNPNYSNEKKIKAIDKQLALIASLNSDDLASLSFSAEVLQQMKKETLDA